MSQSQGVRALIEVRVRLYATLRRYHPELKLGEELTAHVPEGTTVAQLVAAIGIPPDTVRKVFSKGRAVEEDHVLVDGEDVALFPPIAGGDG